MKNKTMLLGVVAALLFTTVFTGCPDPTDTGTVKPALTGTVTINNTSPEVGDTLTATYAPGNGSGAATWVWLAGNTVITGANSHIYEVTDTDLNKVLKARVSYANQSGSVTSAETDAVAASTKQALTGTVTINNTTPEVGDTLTATYAGGNGSGDPTWIWLADDEPIEDANANTYEVVAADLDKTLKARVSYADQRGSITSEATEAVTESTKVALTGTVTITPAAAPKVGDTLTASYSGGNGSGAATWQWLANDVAITGANSTTYTVDLDDVGKTLKARVSYADQSGSRESAATAAVIRAALTGTVTISNTSPQVGDTLTATYTDGNGSGAPTWAWLADDTAIDGATSNTYEVVAGDLGKALKAKVSYANQSGSVESEATAAVAASTKPALTGTVTIDNTSPKVGDTLTASYSGGNGSGAATWIWKAGNDAINGANTATYTVVAGDLGKTLTASVGFADQSGTIESNPTAAVAAPPRDADPPVISAPPAHAAYNTADGGTAPALTVTAAAPASGGALSYQWYSNATNSNEGGTAVTNGTGGTSASYTPVTTTAATAFYYVVVTNTDTTATGTQTATVTSAAARYRVYTYNAGDDYVVDFFPQETKQQIGAANAYTKGYGLEVEVPSTFVIDGYTKVKVAYHYYQSNGTSDTEIGQNYFNEWVDAYLFETWNADWWGNATSAANAPANLTRLGGRTGPSDDRQNTDFTVGFTYDITDLKTLPAGLWVNKAGIANVNWIEVTKLEFFDYKEPEAVSVIKLDETTTALIVGGVKTLTLTTTPEGVPLIAFEIEWESDNENVATVTPDPANQLKATVTGIADGSATITATVKGTTVEATCDVTVTTGYPWDANTYYIIEESGVFTALKGDDPDTPLGTSVTTLANAIDAIKADAAAADVAINFGAGKVLTVTSSATFNGTGWGEITLEGKITSASNIATVSIGDAVSVTIKAEIYNTFNRTGTGTTTTSVGRAVHITAAATGTVTVEEPANLSAVSVPNTGNGGIALLNAGRGTVEIKGGLLESNNNIGSGTGDRGCGTVNCYSTSGNIANLTISGGTIKNTKDPDGFGVYMNSNGTTVNMLTLSGGTIDIAWTRAVGIIYATSVTFKGAGTEIKNSKQIYISNNTTNNPWGNGIFSVDSTFNPGGDPTLPISSTNPGNTFILTISNISDNSKVIVEGGGRFQSNFYKGAANTYFTVTGDDLTWQTGALPTAP